MTRTRTLLAAIASLLAAGAIASPGVQAQPLPGGSVSLEPDFAVPIPIPAGSAATQLPALPFPLAWHDPAQSPPAQQFVASNWVVPFSYCPAPNQRAFAHDGTQLWCAQLSRTDARLWAPYPTPVPYPAPALAAGLPTFTEVANSLGAKPCPGAGATAIDPSNGQAAFCDYRHLTHVGTIWQYETGS